MPLTAQVHPTIPTRPCRFCLSLRDQSVFADFDVDEENLVFLRRISFDGYGCCGGDFKKMGAEDSLRLIAAVARSEVDNTETDEMLRRYFHLNSSTIWSDALASHDLL